MKQVVVEFRDDIWERLKNAESVLMWVTYVKERGEVFLMEETREVKK